MWCGQSVRSDCSVCKIYRFVFLVLLCIITAGLWTFSQVRADYALETGASGTCTWTYAVVDNVLTLTIKPTNGAEGTLEAYDTLDANFHWSWRASARCSDTKRVVVEETVKVGSTAKEMFKGFYGATDMDLQGLDLSEVTSTENMFHDCLLLTTLTGPKDWNVSNVTNMRHMFDNCKVLTSLDVSNWNVGNVEDMEEMFSLCGHLAKLDVKNWNVSKVTNMKRMFSACVALTTLPVDNWDVSKVRDMNSMFSICIALTSLNVSAWKTGNVTDMQGMFEACQALTTLPVSDWDVSKVTSMEYMFSGCKALTTLDVSKWDVSALLREDDMFGSSVFGSTDRLATMYLGTSANKFITEKGKRDSIGALVGTAWQQIDASKGGTEESPKGKVFANAGELMAFHSDRTKRSTDQEGYVRVAPVNLKINFLKGNSAVEGTMEPQEYKPGETKPLSPCGFTWANHKFQGWKGPDNKDYADKALYEYPGPWKRVTQPGEEVPQETLDFTAQWESVVSAGSVTLTYKAKDTGTALERTSETVAPGTNPKGCRVTSNIPSDKKAKWTVKTGNARANWLHVGQILTPEKIKDAVAPGSELSDMTFEVELVGFATLTYKTDEPGIILNPPSEEIIPGEDPKGTTITSTIPPGKVAKWTIPSRPGWSFTGTTLTPDAIKSAQVGGGDLTDITFQVELTDDKAGSVTLTYKAKDSGVTLERASEKVAPGANPKGCRVTSNIPVDKKAKWTVKTGNARANWYSVGATLTPEKIKGALESGQNLFDMTFEVELVGFTTLTYKTDDPGITLNPPSEEVIPGEDPKGTTITSTIPPGKVAKWTIPSRPGWYFEGKTLTPDVIKSVQVGGGDLTDMTFEVKLVDEGGTDDKNGKGGTDDKNGKGGTDDKNGKGGTDDKGGKGGTSGFGNTDASNKLGGGSSKETSEGSLTGTGTQSQNGAQKGAKHGNRRLAGTGDNTPSAPLGFAWLGFIASAMAIMFRRTKGEGRTK